MKVTIDKATLIQKLEWNRSKHKEQYEKAVEGFKKRATTELRSRIEKIEAGNLGAMHPNDRGAIDWREWAIPRDETSQYDRAIGMLRMTADEKIELSESDYEAYVLDRWEWSDRAALINSSYAGA